MRNLSILYWHKLPILKWLIHTFTWNLKPCQGNRSPRFFNFVFPSNQKKELFHQKKNNWDDSVSSGLLCFVPQSQRRPSLPSESIQHSINFAPIWWHWSRCNRVKCGCDIEKYKKNLKREVEIIENNSLRENYSLIKLNR